MATRPSSGLDSEVGFWHALLDPKNGNNSEVDPAAWKSAQDWVESGAFAAEVDWNVWNACQHLATRWPLQVWSPGTMTTFAPSWIWLEAIRSMAPRGSDTCSLVLKFQAVMACHCYRTSWLLTSALTFCSKSGAQCGIGATGT